MDRISAPGIWYLDTIQGTKRKSTEDEDADVVKPSLRKQTTSVTSAASSVASRGSKKESAPPMKKSKSRSFVFVEGRCQEHKRSRKRESLFVESKHRNVKFCALIFCVERSAERAFSLFDQLNTTRRVHELTALRVNSPLCA